MHQQALAGMVQLQVEQSCTLVASLALSSCRLSPTGVLLCKTYCAMQRRKEMKQRVMQMKRSRNLHQGHAAAEGSDCLALSMNI